MNITIKPAGKEDLPAIYDLFKEFAVFQKTPEKLYITLEQLVEDEKDFKCLAAIADGQIVGFATYFHAYYSWTGKAIYLDDLYVKDSHRKFGLGGQLLDGIIVLARNSHCKTVRWLVSRWNTNAIEFYKRLGAHIDDTEMTAVLPL